MAGCSKPARRAGRDHLRCAESCQHHRRHPALQGAAPALRQSQSRRARAAPEGHPGLPHAPHRDRRRVLDGRQHRAACARSAISPTGTTRLVMVDDSHATGFMGAGGRGTAEHCGVAGSRRLPDRHASARRSAAAAAATPAAARPIIAWLRQRSRPYLFSNSIPPVVAAATLRALDLRREHARAARHACSDTRANSAPACRPRDSNCCPASIRSFRS